MVATTVQHRSVVEPARRMEYLRVVRGVPRRALVDFDVAGEPHFADQEPTEVRWFSFVPSKEEHEAVQRAQMALQSELVFVTDRRPATA